MISSFRLIRPLSLIQRKSFRSLSVANPIASTPPVSILAGFLGAGKTSTLTHLLQNRDGLKVGVIVNDVASVNVDANIMKRLLSSDQDSITDMIELENGCVCCGPEAGQLAPAVKSLIETGIQRNSPFDHIVIELSGVADPSMVKHLLLDGGVDVDRVVTLVDSDSFPLLYHSSDTMANREDLGGGKEATEADPCVAMKKVVELLITQIEEADLIVANKVDLASSTSLQTTLAVCRALNEHASVLQTKLGQMPLTQLLPHINTNASKDHIETSNHSHDHSHDHAHSHDDSGECSVSGCNDPTHDHSHSHDHSQSLAAENMGINNFVYRADRPFSEKRLMSQVIDVWPLPQKDILRLKDYSDSIEHDPESNNSFAPVLRSKGWISLDLYPNEGIFWTHAGRHLGLELVPASMVDPTEIPTHSQEIVFIGMNISESKIKAQLDNCLLSDDEMERFADRLKNQASGSESTEVELPRFAIGTAIEALTGPGTWETGSIVAHHYREPNWPNGKTAPYQIRLDSDHGLIYAPVDDDSLVRQIN